MEQDRLEFSEAFQKARIQYLEEIAKMTPISNDVLTVDRINSLQSQNELYRKCLSDLEFLLRRDLRHARFSQRSKIRTYLNVMKSWLN